MTKEALKKKDKEQQELYDYYDMQEQDKAKVDKRRGKK